MRKADIVRHIAAETALPQGKAEAAVAAIFEAIKGALQQGDAVILRRFGSFQVRDKRARLGRNPKTGQDADIPARRVVRFQSGSQLKEAVHGSTSKSVKSVF